MNPEPTTQASLARELERLRTENNRLSTERDQLRLLFNQAPAMICLLLGPAHVFTYANPLYQQLVGGRDVVGKSVREALPEIAGQGFYELLDGVYATGESFIGNQMPVQLARPGDGQLELCYVNFVYQALKDPEGRVIGIQVHAVDVTEMVEAREALQRSETRYRQLADSMAQLIFVARPDGYHEYFNRRWYEYTGVSEGGTDDWGWRDVLHPDDFERTTAVWRHSLETGAPYEVEYRFRRHDGEYRWFVGRAMPGRDEQGRIVKWYGTLTDIHDQRLTADALQEANETLAAQQEELQMQAEELQSQQEVLADFNRELAVSELRFRQLADAMPQMLFTAEPDGSVDYYNQRWFDYTGMTFDETKGWEWKPVHHPDDLQRTIDTWTRCVATGELYTIEYRLQRASDGMYRWHLGRGVPVRDEAGRIVKWYGTNTDIHDQKLAELALQQANETMAAQQEELQMQTEELQSQQGMLQLANDELMRLSAQAQAANKMKSEFLANMSHELRTPLNSIIGYTELVLLISGAQLGETEHANLEVVLRNARHLLSLINDVLDLSKIEAGKATVHPEAFDPVLLVEAVMGTAEPLAREKGLRLTTRVAPGLGAIVSDETKVRQILLNLVSNAVKFTKEGGVDVSIEQRGPDRWAVVVADTGIGIAAEHQQMVFEEFRQVDASSTRQAGGTGLGLSIARGLARLLGGQLSLDSEPGRGSTFTVELPRMIASERHTAPLVAPPATAMAPVEVPIGSRVLVAIDDDPEALRLLMEYLRGTDFTVVPAGDGAAGLRLVRELRPAMVTLDVLMPGLDGWEVLRELKRDPATAGIPVVMLSFVDNKALGFNLGAAAYLTKPVEREQLLEAITRLAPDGPSDGYVLVVEDEPDTRSLYRQVLSTTGLKVAEAPDGQAAIDLLDVLSPKPPALVVLDLGLPHVDGFGVLARLRSDPRTREVPVIVATARDLGPEELGRLEGVRQVVPKGDLAERLAVQDLRSLLLSLVQGAVASEGR